MQKIPIMTEQKIKDYFKENFPLVGFELLQSWMRKGEVKVNNQKITRDYYLVLGDVLRLPPKDFFPEPRSQEKILLSYQDALAKFQRIMIYEDQDLIIVNKPTGLAVQGGSGLYEYIDLWIQSINQSPSTKGQYGLVHRLDRDTSGILVIAKNRAMAQKLSLAWQKKKVSKYYLAWSHARIDATEEQGLIDAPIIKSSDGQSDRHQGFEKMVVDFQFGQEATSHWKILEEYKGKFLYELQPYSGRKHQLRVHLSYYDAPIIGDRKYGGKQEKKWPRLFLHAHHIILPDECISGGLALTCEAEGSFKPILD